MPRLRQSRYYMFDWGVLGLRWINEGLLDTSDTHPELIEIALPNCDKEDMDALVALLKVVEARKTRLMIRGLVGGERLPFFST